MVGQLIGKYRVVEQVGRGGMGTVYRAVDETLHRDVALKVLNTDSTDPGIGRRFRAEAVAIARLNHPGIATIYELFEHDNQWLMAMEFVRGETLESLVARTGPLTADRAAELAQQALLALAHAHQMGVIHRDLKPANLMVNDAGRLKVTDFGIARVAGTEHLTSIGFMMGTPAYMAPEQVLGNEIDARTDLYAIACVMYFLTTTKLPFKGVTPMELAESRIRDMPTPIRTVRELPPWFGTVLDRALNRDPSARYQTADEFRDALRRGLAGLPIDVSSTPDALETVMPGSLSVDTGARLTDTGRARAAERPPTLPVAVPQDTPNTEETRLLSSTAAPMLKPSPTPTGSALSPTPSGSTPSPTGSVASPPPVPPLTGAVGPISTGPVAAPVQGKKPAAMWPALAVAAVLLLVLGGVWLRSRSTPPPAPPPALEPAPPPIVTPPPVEVTPPPPNPPTGGSTPPATPPAPTSTEKPPVPPPATTNPGGQVGGSAGAASGTTPATGTSPAGTTPATSTTPGVNRGSGRRGPAETPVAFENVRFLRVIGRRGEDFDATLRFASGAIVVTPKRAGADPISVPYRELQRATYVRERNPKWVVAPTLATPPADLSVPGIGFMGRGSRHWVVLQGQTWYIILSLEDNNWQQVLNTVSERTRVKIDQPGASKDD